MSHAVKMLKQMLLHTTCLANALSSIIPRVIRFIPKAGSALPNILFTKTLIQLKINQIVAITINFTVYLMPHQ